MDEDKRSNGAILSWVILCSQSIKLCSGRPHLAIRKTKKNKRKSTHKKHCIAVHKRKRILRSPVDHVLWSAEVNWWDVKSFHFYCARVIYWFYSVRTEAFHYILRLFSYAIQIVVAFLFVLLKRIVSNGQRQNTNNKATQDVWVTNTPRRNKHRPETDEFLLIFRFAICRSEMRVCLFRAQP